MPSNGLEAFAAIADIQLKNKDHDGAHETAAQIVLLSAKLKNPLQQVTLIGADGSGIGQDW
ncbi:MAG: hypothetical protein VB913_07925 [Rhodospirillales bacterium]